VKMPALSPLDPYAPLFLTIQGAIESLLVITAIQQRKIERLERKEKTKEAQNDSRSET
jgi:uncharacterized membrane protein